MSIENRYIPTGARAIRNKSGSAVAYLYQTKSGRIAAIGYRGNRAIKPHFHYTYKDQEQRNACVSAFLIGADAVLARKEKQQAERRSRMAQPHGLKVGDVLVSSWGWEQTNVDYYQVTKLIGVRTVEIRPIAKQSEETAPMQGECVPAVNHFTGKPMRKRVGLNDEIKITSFSWAYKVKTQEVAGITIHESSHWTAYA